MPNSIGIPGLREQTVKVGPSTQTRGGKRVPIGPYSYPYGVASHPGLVASHYQTPQEAYRAGAMPYDPESGNSSERSGAEEWWAAYLAARPQPSASPSRQAVAKLSRKKTMVEAEEFTKPGTANVSPSDLKKLGPLMKHYAAMAHPFTVCKRDQMKHGLSEDHANRRCAVLKDLIRGTTKWRNNEELTEAESFAIEQAILVENEAIEMLREAAETLGPVTVAQIAEREDPFGGKKAAPFKKGGGRKKSYPRTHKGTKRRESDSKLAQDLQAMIREQADFLETMDELLAERDVSTDERKSLKKRKLAMADNSFPIANAGDLRNAMRAIGRASADKRAAVKAHIKRAAKQLGLTKLLTPAFGGT